MRKKFPLKKITKLLKQSDSDSDSDSDNIRLPEIESSSSSDSDNDSLKIHGSKYLPYKLRRLFISMDIDLPDVDLPDININLPDIDVDLPDVDLSDIDMDLPSNNMNRFVPARPQRLFNIMDLPDVDLPDIDISFINQNKNNQLQSHLTASMGKRFQRIISSPLERYLKKFDSKPETFSQLFEKYNIPEEDEFCCPISRCVMDKPVLLDNQHFDFPSLEKLPCNNKGERINPLTRDSFLLIEIQPYYDICTALQEKIDAAEKLSQQSEKLLY